jgi:predicted adenylyl cyclase CyaB
MRRKRTRGRRRRERPRRLPLAPDAGHGMRNIEIKAPAPDPVLLEERLLALPAPLRWTRRQRDVFFSVPAGYLKLRIPSEGPGELIAYEREAGSGPRPSDYDITPVADPVGMEQILSRSLGVRGEVSKERRLFLWRHTRIHLDEVEELGAFVELEGVAREIPLAEAKSEVDQVITALDLDPATFLDRPYLEMLEDRG